MFDQAQIQEFKEAFNMIDQDRDGFISKEDLHDTLASMGKNPTDEYLEEMINEATGPINFTMFLTMFGDKLNGTDPETVIMNAFACFDQNGIGSISEENLRDLLTSIGDRFTEEECEKLGINEGDKFSIETLEDGIVLKKYESSCQNCRNYLYFRHIREKKCK